MQNFKKSAEICRNIRKSLQILKKICTDLQNKMQNKAELY